MRRALILHPGNTFLLKDSAMNDLGRRKILKLSAASGVAAAGYGLLSPATGNARNRASEVPKLYLQPFIDPLPMAPIKTPTTLVPTPARLPVPGEAGRDPHQRFEEFRPQIHYEVKVRAGRHRFHSHLPEEQIWGYDGVFPGPTFVNRIGVPITVRFRNELPQDVVGFGTPEIITHLHGSHIGSSSDGFAGNYYSARKAGPTLAYPGAFYDHHYPHFPHGGDLREITNMDSRAGVVKRRQWKFERKNGLWAINDRFFDPERVDALVKQGEPEIWTLDTGGGWAYPVHIHLEDFRILAINAKPPPPEWSGRKDVIALLPGSKAEVLAVSVTSPAST